MKPPTTTTNGSVPSLATPEPVVGIWDEYERRLFTRYRVTCRFVGWVMGGIPQHPDLIESWLRQRILGGDEELRIMLIKTLEDLEIEVRPDATREEIVEAARRIAATRNGNTFRRDEQGLYLADYQVKALLKEACAIRFPYQAGNKWGATRKTPRAALAEWVFLDEARVYLGRTDPDGTFLHMGHVMSPKGPRSTLTYYDYCDQPTIAFTVSSFQDEVTADQWRDILLLGQRLGLGALRSLGYGQFRVIGFERV